MTRRSTAHDLADYARCPRAWWYDRHEELAQFDAEGLTARLQARRAGPGRRVRPDAETELIRRLLQRHERFAGGRAAHSAAAQRDTAQGRRIGCLPAAAVLCVPMVLLCMLLAHDQEA